MNLVAVLSVALWALADAARSQTGPTLAFGVAKELIVSSATTAADQALKTATEIAVRRGLPLPIEEYDVSHTFGYYSERTSGFYAGRALPSRDLLIWTDRPGSDYKYALKIDGASVAVTDSDRWFIERTRDYNCSRISSAGTREEFHIASQLKYWGACSVKSVNLVHAVYVHPAFVVCIGPLLPPSCTPIGNVQGVSTTEGRIGRASHTLFTVSNKNIEAQTTYIAYDK